MVRRKRHEIEKMLGDIQARTQHPTDLYDFDWKGTQPRLVQRGPGVPALVSPRLTITKMYDYLMAFLDGMDTQKIAMEH